MFQKFLSLNRFVRLSLMLTAALAVVGALTFGLAPSKAKAHCDSYQGPVASAARQALQAKDVELVLPYVSPDMEAELTAAFEQALSVRRRGGEARELADRYFIETAVRLHRESEGAPYTGVKDEPVPEAIVIADHAMETGSLNEVYEVLDEEMRTGIEANYHKVVEAREQAEEEGTVEANRERVEAELAFEKYIYDLHVSITGPVGHEGEAEGGHEH
jgi:hypothetical protein